ncbi:glucosamine--fructose-6-phosphate aminotransferase [Thiohalophilus thiocyanatoxydans]|uniref:Uncharacterized protein n=1 Tax=Thiohalophilus thiocyanatoxydans TaxID=381308 RepID=A0A4R8ITM6_9GAMM|nr:glucosamine--fructose-6-phosphate aminotransferase [Thiohalophilus thiocyanatoxydans]TDY01027.1 hypothetical protein EDC23_1773 [Thiohalophilus thiocyanatoxydans]
MLKLLHTIEQRDPDALIRTLKRELESGGGANLPLDQGTSEGGYSDASDLQVTVLGIEQSEMTLQARIGVFFTEIVANCSCGDEPVHKPAYCRMQLSINRATGTATAVVMAD